MSLAEARKAASLSLLVFTNQRRRANKRGRGARRRVNMRGGLLRCYWWVSMSMWNGSRSKSGADTKIMCRLLRVVACCSMRGTAMDGLDR
ncbi:hypothetical protein BDW66DRAFT_40731 [Aspergillus desertorum]